MTNCLLSKKSKSSKVFPIKNKVNGTCCICYTTKNKFVRCCNPKCEDGIVCFDCLKKMTPYQKTRCQICQVKTNVFQDTLSKPIEIIVHREDHIIVNRKLSKKLRCKVSNCVGLFFQSLFCLGLTYSTGLLFLWLISGELFTNFNPMFCIMVGGIVIVLPILLIIFVRVGCDFKSLYFRK